MLSSWVTRRASPVRLLARVRCEANYALDAPPCTVHDLKELLADNEITGFDPVAEAFKVYDPEGTGFADTDIMRQVFTGLGYTDLSDEDLDILVEAADKDGDGLVSLEDFRSMVYAAGSTDPAKGTAAGQ